VSLLPWKDGGRDGNVLDVAVNLEEPGEVRLGVYQPGEPPNAVVYLNAYGARMVASRLIAAIDYDPAVGFLAREDEDWAATWPTPSPAPRHRFPLAAIAVLTGVAGAAAFALLTRALARWDR